MAVSSTTTETDERTAEPEDPWKPVGHHVWRNGDKVAMCGKPILGIKAFGDFEVCPECFELMKDQHKGWNGDF